MVDKHGSNRHMLYDSESDLKKA